MGSSDADAPSKAPKTSAVPQEQPLATSSSPTTTVHPDWSGFQGSHPFSSSAVPSPNGNTEAFGAVPGGTEGDGESSEGKERSSINGLKGSLGSLNTITGKNNNGHGHTSAAAKDALSQSGESGTESSSEGSDTNSQQDTQRKMSEGQNSSDAMASPNAATSGGSLNGVAGAPRQATSDQTMPEMPMPVAVAGPTTNLSIGMDYWGTPTPPVPGKVPPTTVAGAMVSGGPSERSIQDERELKRERRKQSNRESARRSRLRKQAECEELAQRVEALKEENAALKAELDLVKKNYEGLLAHNASLKVKLESTPKGVVETRPDMNKQNSGDETEMHLGPCAHAARTDTTVSGH